MLSTPTPTEASSTTFICPNCSSGSLEITAGIELHNDSWWDEITVQAVECSACSIVGAAVYGTVRAGYHRQVTGATDAEMNKTYSVLIIDMYHYDADSDYSIGGFPTYELAREFARRWVRDSVEELRQPDQTAAQLRKMWYGFGEDAVVIGGEPHYAGSHELDFFIHNPAAPEERDWQSIRPLAHGGAGPPEA